MSDNWHFTRLRFEGYSGVAKLHGKVVKLDRMPRLPEIASVFVAIDYIPEVHMVRIQPLAGPWRDMTADEIRAADRVLWDLAG